MRPRLGRQLDLLQNWAIDITYIHLVAGWRYLVAVLDLYTRSW